MRNDYISLVEMVDGETNGFSTRTAGASTDCWSEKKSTTRAEYYSALSAGIKVDAVFEVSPIDYQTQERLIHHVDTAHDVTYDIGRSYQTRPDAVELTCTRRD